MYSWVALCDSELKCFQFPMGDVRGGDGELGLLVPNHWHDRTFVESILYITMMHDP